LACLVIVRGETEEGIYNILNCEPKLLCSCARPQILLTDLKQKWFCLFSFFSWPNCVWNARSKQ